MHYLGMYILKKTSNTLKMHLCGFILLIHLWMHPRNASKKMHPEMHPRNASKKCIRTDASKMHLMMLWVYTMQQQCKLIFIGIMVEVPKHAQRCRGSNCLLSKASSRLPQATNPSEQTELIDSLFYELFLELVRVSSSLLVCYLSI